MRGAVLSAVALLALGIAAPVPARAEAESFRQLKDMRPHVADPSLAYIWVRGSSRVSLLLMREVSDSDAALVAAQRQTRLAREQARYERRRANYERDLAAWRETRRGSAPQPPVAPTLETVGVIDAGVRNMVQISASPPFRKPDVPGANGEWGYLVAAPPGRYVIVGPIERLPTTVGTCLCMGTVAFETRAGAITDMGVMSVPSPAPVATDTAGLTITFAESSVPIPDVARAGMNVERARYTAAGWLPNYYSRVVDRIAPIPGVISYRRGRVIDEANGQREVPPERVD